VRIKNDFAFLLLPKDDLLDWAFSHFAVRIHPPIVVVLGFFCKTRTSLKVTLGSVHSFFGFKLLVLKLLIIIYSYIISLTSLIVRCYTR
jgi:hypothetical protein